MMLLRLLNPQGIAGLVASVCLALLLVIQKGETRNGKKESGRFEQLYAHEQASFAGTVANYRVAADAARAADKANAERAAAEQRLINERTSNDLEARLAAARSLAQRLRLEAARAPADPRSRGNPPVPGVPAATGQPPEAAGQDRLPDERAGRSEVQLGLPDALTATEQAIQLDELIRWVKAQAAVDPNHKVK